MATLRAALVNLGVKAEGISPFVWERDKTVRVPKAISGQFHKGRRAPNFVNDLLEYCWIVYEKA